MVSGFARFAALTALVGLATGCGGSPVTESSPSPTAEAGEETATAPEGEAPAAADFDAPLVPGNTQVADASVGVDRLIAPTNPDARANEAAAALKKQNPGSRDPFAIPLSISPSVQTSGDGTTSPQARAAAAASRPQPIAIPPQSPPILTNPPTPTPSAAPSPPAPSSSGTASSGSPGTSSGSASPSESAGSTPERAAEAAIAQPPAPPSPSEAQGVLVTGVVQVGNDYKIVVEVPGERTARYVSVGDRLSDGSVLVKRVELDELLDPVVVFEQYGQEVLKPVGEAPSSQVAAVPDL